MRNLKKFLALVLATLMVVSAAATVSAFNDVADNHQFAEAINDLAGKKIVKGKDAANTTYDPTGAVTRKQMAIMMARATTGLVEDDAIWQQGGLVVFTDVVDYQYAIAVVSQKGIINGYTDITGKLVFAPEDGITYAQALKMAVCALGYDDGKLAWWQGYYNVALDLGLTDGLNYITSPDTKLNRGEVAQLIQNMLYATPADGGECFASKYFNLKTADNATTFAITATNKQRATETIEVAEGGYVGLQQIVNDVPSGDVLYLPISEFGWTTDAEAEDYFLRAYDLINWNAEEGTYGAIEAVGTVNKIYNTDITETDKGYFTYDGKNYYTVEANTDTPIRNEVVVFDVNNSLYVHTMKILLLDKDGCITDDEGNLLLKAVYSTKGDIIAYQVYVEDEWVVVTEEIALDLYGTPIASYDPSFLFLDADDLYGSKAYELTVYDDDEDGYMDRAYYNPVYLDVWKKASNKKNTFGIMKGEATSTYVNAEGKKVNPKTGDVLKYTYNWQLNEVTVLGYGETRTGTLTRVNTTLDNAKNNYTVKLTIDGNTYTMANLARDNAGVDGFSIVSYSKTADQISDLKASSPLLGYTYDINFSAKNFHYGDLVRFLVVDGLIVLIETYDIEETYNLVVLEQATDFDSDAVYMDLWMDGELKYDVPVTKIWVDDEYVDLADLNIFEYNELIAKIALTKTGYIYRTVPTAGGYQLSEAFKNTTDDQKRIVGLNSSSKWCYLPNDFGIAYLDEQGKTIKFDDGIGEATNTPDDEVLVTDGSTIFYFINTDKESVSVYQGMPQDGATITYSDSVAIYADKIGYSNGVASGTAKNPQNETLKGTAYTVVVYYKDLSDIKGFGLTGVGERIIYVTKADDAGTGYWDADGWYFEPYDNGTGEELGLPKQYWNDEFWYYNTAIAIDMETGAPVDKIYANVYEDIYEGGFFYLSSDNIITGEVDDDMFATIVMDYTEIVDARYYTINDVETTDPITGIRFVYDNVEMTVDTIADTRNEVKTLMKDGSNNYANREVTYLKSFDGGVFVGIVDPDKVYTNAQEKAWESQTEIYEAGKGLAEFAPAKADNKDTWSSWTDGDDTYVASATNDNTVKGIIEYEKTSGDPTTLTSAYKGGKLVITFGEASVPTTADATSAAAVNFDGDVANLELTSLTNLTDDGKGDTASNMNAEFSIETVTCEWGEGTKYEGEEFDVDCLVMEYQPTWGGAGLRWQWKKSTYCAVITDTKGTADTADDDTITVYFDMVVQPA